MFLFLDRYMADTYNERLEVMMNYAIFRSGNKQYKASPGTVIDVDRLSVEGGTYVEIKDVLAVSHNGDVVFGAPVVADASVIAQVEGHAKDDKIIVFKYKRKVRYRRKKGHRQQYTRLLITSIMVGEEEIGIVEGAEIAADMLAGEEDDEEIGEDDDLEEDDEDELAEEDADEDEEISEEDAPSEEPESSEEEKS